MIKSFWIFILVLFFLTSTQPILGQVEFIGSYNKNDIQSGYEIIGSNDQLFLRGTLSKSVVAIDNQTKTLKTIHNCIQGYTISAIINNENGVIYSEYKSGSNNYLRIWKCDNNFNKTLLKTYNPYESAAIWFCHNSFLYYYTKQLGVSTLRKLNTLTNQEEILYQSSNDFRFINNKEATFIFSSFTSNNAIIIQSTNNQIDTLYQLPYTNYLNFTKIESNNLIYQYFRLWGASGTYKWNSVENTFSLFSSQVQGSLFFENDSTFISNLKRGHVKSDTVYSIETFPQVQAIQSSGTGQSTYFYNFPSPYGQLINNKIGAELLKINEEDSLSIIKELKKGVLSSMPTIGCSYSSISSNLLKGFFYNNVTYTTFSNSWDKELWIYDVQNDSIIPVFPIVGYSSNTYFKLIENYVYWINYDPTNKDYQVYRWNMNNPYLIKDESKPQENMLWHTSLEHTLQGFTCFDYPNNIHPQNIITDNENNTYVGYIWSNLGNFHNGTYMIDHLNASTTEVKTSHYLLKYDKHGNSIWSKNIGSKSKGFARFDKLLLTNESNLAVVGQFYNDFYFDDDSISIARSNIYFAEFDSNTGEKTKFKALVNTDFVDNIVINDLIQDNKGNYYFGGHYYNNSIQIGDTTLISDWNVQNYIVKLNNDGEVIWAQNIHSSWDNILGVMVGIQYNYDSDEIIVLCSQNGSYSCEIDSWQSELITFSANGNYKNRLVYSGNLSHYDNKLFYLGNNKTLIKGIYRGAINADVYRDSTASGENCFNYESYDLIYNNSLNRIMNANSSNLNNAFSVSSIRKFDDFLFILGYYKERNRMAFLKYNLEGEYLGEYLTLQYYNDNSYSNRSVFDVNNGLFSLAGVNLRNDPTIDFANFNNHSNMLNLAKFEVNVWNPNNPMIPMKINNIDENSLLQAYPNPVERTIEINFNTINNFTHYEVVNSQGQLIIAGTVPNEMPYVRIDCSTLSKGIYFVRLKGHENVGLVKIMKY